jgi:dCTP deaminase
MILSDKSIKESLRSGRIGCHPRPDGEQIQPASLDVRLGRELYDFGQDRRIEHEEHYLDPGERYLGETKESIRLPNDLAAQLAGRSSIGRVGVIVHKTAGWIDPGFEGSITLELMNLGHSPVQLRAGERVAQLVFFKLDKRSSGYDGNYQNQSGATKSQK